MPRWRWRVVTRKRAKSRHQQVRKKLDSHTRIRTGSGRSRLS